jgi:spoIIIJ-associated protein
MEEKTQKIIKDVIEELIKKIGFTAQISIEKEIENDENIICNIQTEVDSNFLIGQHGLNLQAIQHIARLIVRRKTEDKIHFILDVNSYRKQKNQSVIDLAIQAATEALRERRSVLMKPMTTYERRLVHMELSKNTEVTTESIGEGESRKIVVKPTSEI